MIVRLQKPAELRSDELALWRELQRREPALDSPFLAPEFAQAAARIRRDVEVAILENPRGTPQGFFAFQRTRERMGDPVAAGMSELQAIVASPDLAWSPAELLRGCGLTRWAFDHVPVACGRLRPYMHTQGPSPLADLSAGYDQYRARLRARGSRSLAETSRKARKLERELGELRFQLHADEPRALECLLQWKQQQHLRTQVPDTFQLDWVVALLRELSRQPATPGFRAYLSLLTAGDIPLAVHLGLATGRTAHVWYPAYDHRFAKYSPGMVLFERLFAQLPAEGIARVEFGPGPQRYKQSLKTGDRPVGIGCVDRSPVTRALRRGWQHCKQTLRSLRSRACVL